MSSKYRGEPVLLVSRKLCIQSTHIVLALTSNNLVVIAKSKVLSYHLAEAPGSGVTFSGLRDSCKYVHSVELKITQ